ncbi:unnamed protein product [Lactuca virosa]|uniref:HMA domain-containing protein n=1 Tax=Lactuca virosa TaxID=75947 RepID=A0AAU9MCR0_9ASTR|nr:unnamed protein product [Lactuca virosa]
MDAKPTLMHDMELTEVMTEFMVDLSCEGCVKAVKNKLQTVNGVKSIDVDLSNQVVRIFGTLPVKTMAEALEQTGRKARLIGQGSSGGYRRMMTNHTPRIQFSYTHPIGYEISKKKIQADICAKNIQLLIIKNPFSTTTLLIRILVHLTVTGYNYHFWRQEYWIILFYTRHLWSSLQGVILATK